MEIRGDLYHGIPCRIRSAPADRAALEAGWKVLTRIDDVFNVYRADSELGAINAAGPGSYRVSSWLAECLAVGRQIEALSAGAWSATMLPMVRLWRTAAHSGVTPSASEIATTRAACAPDAWSLEGETLHLRAHGATFDLGGLAKGYAVDLVVALLRERGITDLLVQVGGETACHGRASDGEAQRIGIPHPDDPDGAWCAVLCDPGAGLCGSTSGDYRQALVVAGNTRHHIIDPRTGQPAVSALASVTCAFIGTGKNALADGLSTAATVLGAEALARFAATTGCIGYALRRDPERGLMASETPGWRALLAADA